MEQKELIEGLMNYTGSKYKLLPQILPYFDYTKPISFCC
jgi:site-specific DNA-adenine methylase